MGPRQFVGLGSETEARADTKHVPGTHVRLAYVFYGPDISCFLYIHIYIYIYTYNAVYIYIYIYIHTQTHIRHPEMGVNRKASRLTRFCVLSLGLGAFVYVAGALGVRSISLGANWGSRIANLKFDKAH